jgi:hypothetical protein
MTDFHALSGRWLLLSRPSGHAPFRTSPLAGLGVAGGWKEVFRDLEFVGHPPHSTGPASNRRRGLANESSRFFAKLKVISQLSAISCK